MESAQKDPRRSLHVESVPLPELAPDEAYVAVMASSINFNTVWTSIFEPLPTFGFLDRLGKESIWGRRHALDYHVVGSDAVGRGAAHRIRRAQLEGGRQGHRPVQLRRRPGPLGPRRLHAGGQPAHLGLRDQLRRAGRRDGGQGQPAHAQTDPPELGGGGHQRAVQLHLLPHAGLAQRRRGWPRATRCWSGGPAAVWAASPSSTCSTGAARRSASSPRPRRWRCSTTSGSTR